MNKEVLYLVIFSLPVILFYIALFRKRRTAVYGKNPLSPTDAQYWNAKGYSWDPIEHRWTLTPRKFRVPKN